MVHNTILACRENSPAGKATGRSPYTLRASAKRGTIFAREENVVAAELGEAWR
jgi:hypothetical protein